jgi:16S rRNA (adenine1518-N6/adenine1519-N6)-dimethyltransferase
MRVRENSQDQVVLDQIRTVVRTAFNQRRKTMRNSLSSFLPNRTGPIAASDEYMVSEFEREYGSKRAEELSPTQFVELARLLGVA